MKWLRTLLGTDFPDPQVGQVWRSRNSGRCIRVHAIEVGDCGIVTVSVQHEVHGVWKNLLPGKWVGIPMDYADGFGNWRLRLREEARELVGMEP